MTMSPRFEQRHQLRQRLIDDGRRHHQPDRARLGQPGDQVFERRRANGASLQELRDCLRRARRRRRIRGLL